MKIRRGYTLIELLVAIAIIGVLIGLLLPAIQKVREAAIRMACQNKLKHMGLACLTYYDAKGVFPPAFMYTPLLSLPLVQTPAYDRIAPNFFINFNEPGWGWAVYLLPYIEQNAMYNLLTFTASNNSVVNQGPREMPMPIYTCPADSSTGLFPLYNTNGQFIVNASTISYAACFGADGTLNATPDAGTGVYYRNSATKIMDITDGASQTIALGERGAMFIQCPWIGAISMAMVQTTPNAPVSRSEIQPPTVMAMARVGHHLLNDPMSEPYDYFSPHGTIVNFVYVDGSVHPLTINTDLTVLQALGTRAGGDIVNADW
ncbi:DUF1559 domain-containing protein [Fimbriiglobus ruber]|uniref:DUF1559 domain-containing protein n=1 Tax=Fimbriiglobus ruber TaxID=1908690 RepID=A0A225E8F3_9BACT|nr:DUF1559 domain-containing protein [Fimbriiglobus ruber]OWK46366.1 hypothetical protein FRUB_00065 [Fimbriiglobus ruber]